MSTVGSLTPTRITHAKYYYYFRQWIEHFQNELGDWLEQREIERKQKEEEEKRQAEELKKQEQIKQEEMNQDEQPGENIFIMPDSLKKSDLVSVYKFCPLIGRTIL